MTAPPAPVRRRGRWRLAAGLALAAVVVLAGLDLSRPPQAQLAARGLVGGLRLYRATLSAPLARLGVACRFRPTCSVYAEAVIARDGALRGAARAAGRVLRCGPWTPAGTVDPP